MIVVTFLVIVMVEFCGELWLRQLSEDLFLARVYSSRADTANACTGTDDNHHRHHSVLLAYARTRACSVQVLENKHSTVKTRVIHYLRLACNLHQSPASAHSRFSLAD